MQILNAVREALNADVPNDGTTAELISAELQALRESVMIVANALDMEVDIRLATQEHLHEKREAQKKVRSVDQIRVDSQARDRARLRTSGPTRREMGDAAVAARKAEEAKKVIDSAVALLEDHAETPSDWGVVEALRDALDTEFGVKRDA